MKKFQVFYSNAVTGEAWDEIVLGENPYRVWDECEASLSRDVEIEGVYAL